jgi:threonine dehydratase
MPVVTHSSGNHAQAVALAARLASTATCSVTATIVMPENAPLVKKRAVISYGATIVEVTNTNEAREDAADRIVETTGAVFIHPSEDPRVIAGQVTTCLEMVEQVREMAQIDLDAVIIPVGGGGLASGNTIALRGLLGDKVKVSWHQPAPPYPAFLWANPLTVVFSSRPQIILAEPLVLDDAKRSFTEGTLLKHSPDNTLDSVADGLKTTLGPNTWPIVRDLVDDIFTVTEEEILKATKLVWERLKVCIEPSAGVGVAVAMGAEFNSKYTSESGIWNVGIVLCGGNVDVISIAAKMEKLGL